VRTASEVIALCFRYELSGSYWGELYEPDSGFSFEARAVSRGA
jgi:hypothetical protein